MKKVGIITLNGNNNYGNKLQNYALKKVIENYNYNVETIWFSDEYNRKKELLKRFLIFKKRFFRENKFEKFTLNYLNRKIYKKIPNNFDYFIVGSDQVWNYTFSGVKNKLDRYFLKFSESKKNISYAASIGIDYISDDSKELFVEGMKNFKNISVREDNAKEILSDGITDKKIDVVLDPTMLLTSGEWNNIIRKPKKLKRKKYILNYFLGEQSEERRNKINKFAKENNCEVINILDFNDKFYTSDPSEFLYLEKNAFLICTDSFHSSVFAILFNRPFVVFDREGKNTKMSSRIDTLLSTFKLEDRKFNGVINNKCLTYDYTNAYKILEEKRKTSKEFLEIALEVK